MKIFPTEKYNSSFGIKIKPMKKKVYAPNCWNEVTEGQFKDYRFKLFNNYVDGQHGSTLIVLSKGKEWIKSKLKYIFNGERKAIWSFAKEKKK